VAEEKILDVKTETRVVYASIDAVTSLEMSLAYGSVGGRGHQPYFFFNGQF
jgi:hypothetical protein